MKSKLLLTLLSPAMLVAMTACGNNSNITGMKLTYGTYITSEDSKINDSVEIDYSTLFEKMDKTSKFNKENFLLVIAPTNGCMCWTNFQPVLKQFINDTHYLVYTIKITQFADDSDTFGLNMKQGHVSMAIVKGNKIVKQYLSSSIFDSVSALKAEMNKFVRAPELYFVDRPFLEAKIKSTRDKFLVEYYRSTCSDCAHADIYALWDYAHQNDFTTEMYIIDLDNLEFDGIQKYQTDENGEYVLDERGNKIKTDEYSHSYQEFKNVRYLSNIYSEFGYNTGYVPTFQYYERGHLIDASVYFNDTVTMVDGVLKVTDTYYSISRSNSLGYLEGVKYPILEGLTLTMDDVDDYTQYGYGYVWKHESANTYHKPLFEAFMNKYAIK